MLYMQHYIGDFELTNVKRETNYFQDFVQYPN